MPEPSTTELFAPIEAFCSEYGLPWDGARADQMRAYLDLLERHRTETNLIGPMPRERIVTDLLLDSLVIAAAAAPARRLLDVGTGAGLPGIPLKILYPGVHATLVEPRTLRVAFLRAALEALSITNVTVIEGKLKTAGLKRESFDLVAAKAFLPPPRWIPAARPWVSVDGAVACMARPAQRPEIERAARRARMSVDREVASPTDPARAVFALRPRDASKRT